MPDNPSTSHARDYLLGGLGVIVEYLSVTFGASWLAWFGAFLLWMAFLDYSKKFLGTQRIAKYVVPVLVAVVFVIATTAFLRKSAITPEHPSPVPNSPSSQIPPVPTPGPLPGPEKPPSTPPILDRPSPMPKTPEKPPTLLDLFNNDFHNTGLGVSDNGFDIDVDRDTIHINWRLWLNFPEKSEFVAFYIPSSGKGFEACIALVDMAHKIVTDLPKTKNITGGDASGVTTLRELTFSGRVYIYHEWPLSNKQKADVIELYSTKELDVQFRGLDYLGARVSAWYQEHGKKR